ncbi:MAG TPA: PqqD family protein [Pyrinomonadaceae bacterium]|nr:PqqD family protein [Pyrinomonadaceae bacterium]
MRPPRFRADMRQLDTCYVKGEDLITRHIAGETLLVPVRGHVGDLDSIYTLNSVGSRVWQLIDGSTPVARIIDTINAEYEVAEQEAARDVLALLESLQRAGLIRRAGENEG